jgi:hypothetical protein
VKKIILGIVIGMVAGATATWLVSRHHEKEEHPEEHKEESRVHHDTNGDVYIKIDKATQERIGLKTAPLESAQLSPEVKGYGRVIDPSPLSALQVEQLSAQASLDASTREYERLKGLYAQDQNVSARALEAAEAARKKDQLLVESAKARLALMLGPAAMMQSNLHEFIGSLVSLKTALVRMDTPLGEALPSPPARARLAPVAAEERPIAAEFLGPAPAADPQTQSQGFFFLVKAGSFAPGTAVTGWLQIPGEAQRGIIVPRPALLRHEGELFVYVQTDDETFRRTELHAERPLENGWFVRSGLAPNDKVVIAGAQQLLSEELKAASGGEEE